MIKFSEEDTNSHRPRARLLAPNSQIVNAKEKLLKKIETEETNDKKATKSNCWEGESYLEISNQPQHSLSEILIQSKVLTHFNSKKAERGEEAAESLKLLGS